LQEVGEPVSRISDTVELDEEAHECDEVISDLNINWTSFAQPWPYDTEKQLREPCAKIFSGC
jgi:hypothetical protein